MRKKYIYSEDPMFGKKHVERKHIVKQIFKKCLEKIYPIITLHIGTKSLSKMRTYTLIILQNNELRLKSKRNKNKKNPKNCVRNGQKYNVIIRIRKQHKKLLKMYDFHYAYLQSLYKFIKSECPIWQNSKNTVCDYTAKC